MQEPVLLASQFRIPRPPFGMVERPRLNALVGRSPVTLVCAPPGSGKTALLASALAGAPDVAWLSLEPVDDEPARFWRAIATALEPLLGELVVSPEACVARLASLDRRVLLVLDDLHLVRSSGCIGQLALLLRHAPPALGLVLSTRCDPALPLHLVRLRGGLTEIRAGSLAFTCSEAAALLSAHGVDASLASALCARTEGWAGGLRLAALALAGHPDPERFVASFAADDRVVGDYLVAEVLDRLPRRTRAFLLRTSIVDRVCGSLAVALAGADRLAELERVNGFVVPLDTRREWYRYHCLFASLLRAHARREIPSELPALHRRAAAWFARHGLAVEALRHCACAGDEALALDVLREHWFELLASGADLRWLLDASREDAVLACVAFALGDLARGDARLASASGDLLALGRLCRARLLCDLEAARAAADTLLGEWVTADRRALVRLYLGETALWANEPATARAELSEAVALASAAGHEGLLVAARGRRALCDTLSDGPRAGADEARAAGADGCAQLALALAAFAEQRADDAREHLARARPGGDVAAFAAPARPGGDVPAGFVAPARPCGDATAFAAPARPGGEIAPGRAVAAFVAPAPGAARPAAFLHAQLEAQLALDDPDEALRVLERFERAGHPGAPASYERAALACLRADLHARRGDLDAARAALERVAGEPWAMVAVARARVLLAIGEPDAAVEVLTPELPCANVATRVERAVLQAVALSAGKDGAGASQAIETALELADRTGHRRPLLDGGAHVRTLLRERLRAGTAYRGLALELVDEGAAARPVAPPLEPLTDREQVILRYLPTPLSNREIGSELYVSQNTVKTHLRRIYRKLGATDRRDAVERARRLRLIGSA